MTDIRIVKAEAKKRTRNRVRLETSILADKVLESLLPAVDAAIEQTQKPMVGTDWILEALATSIDPKALRDAAIAAIEGEVLKEIEA